MNPPPLRQSTYEQMSCPHSYALVHIEGLKPPDSLASTRGTEIHAVLANYAMHCAKRRVPADFMYFDSLVDSIAEEPAAILNNLRDSFTVDWQNLLAVEQTMYLDIDFHPTSNVSLPNSVFAGPDPAWPVDGSGKAPAYSGTLYAIYLMPGGKVARIEDYKSHPRPFEPTTFQAKLYTLFLFMHMPELHEVEFVLKFVRYRNVAKPIRFSRTDVPQLIEDVRRERNRQYAYHDAYTQGEEMNAIPGTHCQYCPAISDFSCPVAKLNPMLNLMPEERLKYRLWHEVANRVNNQAMAQYVDGSGQSITSQDANGNFYTFGPEQKTKTTYPLFTDNGEGGFALPIIDALLDWQNAHPEDLQPTRKGQKPWFLNLVISSTKLKSYLSAAKREIVHNAVKDLCTTETKIELRVSRDAQVDDGSGSEHKEFNPEDPEGANVGLVGVWE